MRWLWSTDWRTFFDDGGYPFDMERVESRDGCSVQTAAIVSRLGDPPRRILDLGCGHGRYLLALRRAGYEVYGTDLASLAVRRANQRLGECRAVQANNEKLPFANESFDAAIFMYTSLGYPGTSLRQVLDESRRVVRRQGRLIIDVENLSWRIPRFGIERLPEGIGLWTRYIRGQAVYQRNLALSRSVVGVFGLSHHRFSADALKTVLAESGWRVEHAAGDYEGAPFSSTSARLLITACRSK